MAYFCFIFFRAQVQFSARRVVIVIEVFHVSYQSTEADVIVALQIDKATFIRIFLPFIIHADPPV
jgi:hypothetical protein